MHRESKGDPSLAHQKSRASVTANDFLGSGSMLSKDFKKSQNSAVYKAEMDAALARYDTNNDGTYDHGEVMKIVEEVQFKAFAAEQSAAGTKRMAESLNETKVRETCARAGGGLSGGGAVNGW